MYIQGWPRTADCSGSDGRLGRGREHGLVVHRRDILLAVPHGIGDGDDAVADRARAEVVQHDVAGHGQHGVVVAGRGGLGGLALALGALAAAARAAALAGRRRARGVRLLRMTLSRWRGSVGAGGWIGTGGAGCVRRVSAGSARWALYASSSACAPTRCFGISLVHGGEPESPSPEDEYESEGSLSQRDADHIGGW